MVPEYLSGVRMYHLIKGFNLPALRPATVTLLLKHKGQENYKDIQSKLTRPREFNIILNASFLDISCSEIFPLFGWEPYAPSRFIANLII